MIIFIGLTGAGKSVQAKMLAKRLGFPMLSTGQYLRDNPTAESKQATMAGKLVSDESIVKVVSKMTKELGPQPEFILDGFPRTLTQAQWLVNQNQRGKISIHAVIHLVITKEAAKARLLLRARPDDHEAAINKRFDEYDKNIEKIMLVLKNHKLPIKNVNADDTVDNVHKNIATIIKGLISSSVASDKY